MLRPFDLGDRWAYHALHDRGQCYGLDEAGLGRLYRDAALIINLHGGTEPREELSAGGRLVYLETDPVQLQIELQEGRQSTVDFLAAHSAHFSFAENLGGAGCTLPVDERFSFVATRQR